MRSPAELTPYNGNARTHSKKQVRQIADSITRFGFTVPVLIDEADTILAGHGRVLAAKLLGSAAIPCILVEGMSVDEKRAYVLADNAIALKSGWDKSALAGEFKALLKHGFNMEATGFDWPEIDKVLVDFKEESTEPVAKEDRHVPTPAAEAVVNRRGDIWQLGNHRLVNGDAKEPEVLQALMAGEEPDMVFTDPPYNVKVSSISGKGRTKHREFPEASGEMSRAEFVAFLTAALKPAASACRDGAILYVCIDSTHIPEVVEAGEACGLERKTMCTWAKTNGGMGAFYRSQTEHVIVFKVGTAPHTNNFGLGEGGRSRTTLWTYAGVNTFKADRMEELELHPTVKPTKLVEDAIRDVSNPGEIVLDMFGGSGTTLIAAHKVGRKARMIELDSGYCDAIITRWERYTGKRAILADTGEDFEAVSARRAAELSGWRAPLAMPPATREHGSTSAQEL